MRAKIRFLSTSFLLIVLGLFFSTLSEVYAQQTIPVPNVVGQTLSTATNNLTVAGLQVGTVTRQFSASVPADVVISQNPAANTSVSTGTTVDLVVSAGLPVTVPNVVGQTQSAATTTIQNAGLAVGTVTRQASTTIPASTVISQNPVASTLVAAGTTVDLVVSAGPPVIVPNVVGKTQSVAETDIKNAGLTVGTVTQQASTTVPVGIVISQNPVAGASVASSTAIRLVVSAGPTITVTVPNVVGQTQSVATVTIQSAGLTVGSVTTQSSNTVPSGSVISQNPVAGTSVTEGTAISLVVSSGPPGLVSVPNVVGQTQDAAILLLQNAGLTVGNITQQSSSTVPLGSVISQDPVAGTSVNSGSSVNLVVSSGFSQKQQVAVPDVTGKTVEEAREILFAVGLFQVGAISVQSSSVPAGLIAAQSPVAGTVVEYGTTVNLVVSSGAQPPVETPNVVGLTLKRATSLLEQAGLRVGFVTSQNSNTVEKDRVISQNPLMSALVPTGWAINLVVSLGPLSEDPGAGPQTQVPDVVELTLAAATASLIDAQLRVGVVASESDPEIPAGQVIRQSPPPDTELPVGGKVNLVVSFGPHADTLLSGPAYVTNYLGNTVSIVDPTTDQTTDNIPTGISANGPSGVAISPDGTRLYVANRPPYGKRTGTVSVIDLTARKVIAIIPVGVGPLGVAVSPTGERAFVVNEGSFSMTVIDTRTNQPFIDLNVPNLAANSYPRGVAAHPNPTIPLVYVTNRTVNSFSDDAENPYPDQCDALVARPPVNPNPDQCVGSLSIFDVDMKTQVGSVAVGWAPEGVAVHPDGTLVYVANSGDRTVTVMDTALNRVVGVIALDGFGGAPGPLVPRGVAVSPDGNRLYVTDGAGNRLFVIDIPANHAVTGIVPVGKKPYGVSVSPDNKRVYVANTDDNTVSVVDGRSNRVIAEVPVGAGPWAFGQFVGPLAAVSPPVFDPPGGTYPTHLKVKITTATPGALIRYTTDGGTPTPTSGTRINSGQSITFSTPIPTKVVLKAIAYKNGWADSGVTEATYIIEPSPDAISR